ncbi:MAG: leucyl aminopeptidase family protein [Chloroflexi bacterium]|nr:leucyl aminopeptidase family protein [Chloroflexota bacterium]MBT3668828.1 leucyl aminopeptidase family protein [Chloroflexota bacterium]MBT4306542.1 leucyl aminopeptidase family protein [Chloroflexota bacterium]MBT4533926.1 leucyl aminopeptidase family protein [Chloroflexota bacterium]MBT4681471.1 leucyl aminopeptidase family protein [Chloroflexota bacterium]
MNINLISKTEWKEGLTFKLSFGKQDPIPGESRPTAGSILLMGKNLGEVSLGLENKINAETIRKTGAGIAKWLHGYDDLSIGIDLAGLDSLDVENPVLALCEGLLLGDFKFTEFKNKKSRKPSTINLLGDKKVQSEVDQAIILAEGTNLARSLAHTPANIINPETLSDICEKIAQENDLGFKVLDDKELKEMGAGAIVSVGQGSQTPSRLIVMEYKGKSPDKKPVVLVGKAITFDTGGYSIKTKTGIVGMKYDKCGGVTVAAILQTVAKLGLDTPVIGLIPAAENMISKEAYRPNDIITSLSGKTIEIISTDAEGRMVMSDTLTYAQREYNPEVLIDIATLTGGVVVALGGVRAGIFGTDQKLIDSLIDAGENVHERLWQMPLDEEYFDLIRGGDSDFKNSGGVTTASSVQGAIFLKQFIKNGTKWAHIDIAGTGTINKSAAYCPKGATGFGMRLITEYIRSL